MNELKPSQISDVVDRLAGVINQTPVMRSRTLDERIGRQIFLKCENFQRVGAFKFRGAYHAVSRLSPDEKATGIVTHSSGNHAQGLALAAKLLEVPATIVMPEDAPQIKREATAGYGAKIVTCRAIDREEVSASLVDQYGYTMIHPYDNDDIILGQGTAAWELFEEVGKLDLLFVPVGGGGLISGCALAAAARSPKCRVVGVEPELGDDAGRSWREGAIHRLDHVPQTVAEPLVATKLMIVMGSPSASMSLRRGSKVMAISSGVETASLFATGGTLVPTVTVTPPGAVAKPPLPSVMV
jgi:threonine dehydratase